MIPGRCAFAVKAPKGHIKLSDNLNPELSWSGAPAGTRSFALLCIDPDVPTNASVRWLGTSQENPATATV